MKAIQVAFEDFEKAKIKFAQQVADFAAKPANIDGLYSQGINAVMQVCSSNSDHCCWIPLYRYRTVRH